MYGQYGPRIRKRHCVEPKFIGIRNVMARIKKMNHGELLHINWRSTDYMIWCESVDSVENYEKQEFPMEFYVLVDNVHDFSTDIILTNIVTTKQLKELLIVAKGMRKRK